MIFVSYDCVTNQISVNLGKHIFLDFYFNLYEQQLTQTAGNIFDLLA